MTDSERLQHALDLAYRYLGRRDRTVAEVREHLSAERIEPAVVDEASPSCATGLPRRRALRPALRRGPAHARRLGRRADRAPPARGRGRPALIAAALGERGADEELEAAVAVLRRRFARAAAHDRDRERALGLLVRKGYELELAYDAVRAFERDAA